jgi:hypothetical protein
LITPYWANHQIKAQKGLRPGFGEVRPLFWWQTPVPRTGSRRRGGFLRPCASETGARQPADKNDFKRDLWPIGGCSTMSTQTLLILFYHICTPYFPLFLLRPLTVLMKQTMHAVRPIKQYILLRCLWVSGISKGNKLRNIL